MLKIRSYKYPTFNSVFLTFSPFFFAPFLLWNGSGVLYFIV